MAKYLSIGQLQNEVRKSFASLKKYMDENIRAPVVSIAQQAKALADEVVRRADSGEFKGNKGDKGDKGDTGDTGAAGPQGEPGVIGEPVLDEDGVLQFEAGGVSFLTVVNGKICVIYEDSAVAPEDVLQFEAGGVSFLTVVDGKICVIYEEAGL